MFNSELISHINNIKNINRKHTMLEAVADNSYIFQNHQI